MPPKGKKQVGGHAYAFVTAPSIAYLGAYLSEKSARVQASKSKGGSSTVIMGIVALCVVGAVVYTVYASQSVDASSHPSKLREPRQVPASSMWPAQS